MQRIPILATHRARLAALCLLLAVGLLACALDGARRNSWAPVAPQEWQKERGPVVPHDSFPRDCSLCHAGSNWHTIRKDFAFDHAKETGFALEGAHTAAECLRCHNDRGPVATFAQRGCAGCHEDVHKGAEGKDCATCHAQSDWRVLDATAKHARTRFPLVGAHATAACWTCHPGAQVGQFDRPSTLCADCHAQDLTRAVNPDHQQQGWTSGCQRCHLPTNWGEAGFAHSFFPLNGGHEGLACSACHPGNVFEGTPTSCVACHQDDYDAATNPDHAAAGFGTGCESCHTKGGWSSSTWNHPWPINGAHTSLNCNACHRNDVYQGTPSDCYACHAPAYESAPDHVAGNFPTTCQDCHTTATWKGGSFSHQGISNGCSLCHLDDYQTAPGHVPNNYPTNCEQCHSTSTWQGASFNHRGISTGCFNCHASDYQGAENHVAGNYPTNCEQCHSTTTWEGANFNHSGVSSGCVNCHLTDYQGATSPNHPANGYPTDCQMCHGTNGWDTTFVHSWFPITSGHHAGFTCTACHPTPNSPGVFACINCHEHNQADTNSHHNGVPGYTYTNQGCYNCHPNGGGEGGGDLKGGRKRGAQRAASVPRAQRAQRAPATPR